MLHCSSDEVLPGTCNRPEATKIVAPRGAPRLAPLPPYPLAAKQLHHRPPLRSPPCANRPKRPKQHAVLLLLLLLQSLVLCSRRRLFSSVVSLTSPSLGNSHHCAHAQFPFLVLFDTWACSSFPIVNQRLLASLISLSLSHFLTIHSAPQTLSHTNFVPDRKWPKPCDQFTNPSSRLSNSLIRRLLPCLTGLGNLVEAPPT